MGSYTNPHGYADGTSGADTFLFNAPLTTSVSADAFTGVDRLIIQNMGDQSSFFHLYDDNDVGSFSAFAQAGSGPVLQAYNFEDIKLVGSAHNDSLRLDVGSAASGLVDFDGGAGIDGVFLDFSRQTLGRDYHPSGGALSGSFGTFANFESIRIAAGSGDDQFSATGGRVSFDGGFGFDTFTYTATAADGPLDVTVYVRFGVMSGGSAQAGFNGVERVALTGSDHDDSFRTNYIPAGALSLDGGGGTDSLIADLRAFGANSFIVGADGTITSNRGTFANLEKFDLVGGPEADVFTTQSAADVLDGQGGDDQLSAGVGEDILDGGAGDDRLDGGAGDDVIYADAGNDTVIGGDGIDLAYVGRGATFTATGAGWTVASFSGTDTLTGVEIVNSSGRNVLLVGSGGFATIQEAVDAAGDGDTIVIAPGTYRENVIVDKDVTILGPNQGMAGAAVRGAEAIVDGLVTISADGVTIDGLKFVGRGPTPQGGMETLWVLADGFTVTNSVFSAEVPANSALSTAQFITGLDISNNLVQGYFLGITIGVDVAGSVHDNRFQGGTGALRLGNALSSESSHILIADNIFDGVASASLALAPFGPDTVDLNSYVTGNIFTNSGVAQPILIIPTRDSPNILGTDLDEMFDGSEGGYSDPEDVFSFDGRGGDDHVTGAEQGDSLSGGAGADALFGNGGDDLLDGGTGVDSMTGGTGNDVFVVDSLGDRVVENAGEGTDEIRTALATYSLVGLANVEKLTATSNAAHDFRGNGGDNVIAGGGGADLLRLYDGGNDTVVAGAGNDNIFFIASLTAADVVNGGEGTDTLVLQGPYGSLTLTSNVTQIENISLLGGGNTNFGDPGTNLYDYVLTTNDANFAAGVQARINGAALLVGEDFTFNGSAETDAKFVVYGGRGVDTLTGGLGNDIFFFAEDRFASGDVVNGGPGYDGMFLRGNYTIDFNAPGYTGLFTSIENLTLSSATDERYARGGGAEFDYNVTLSDAIVKPGETLTVSGTILAASETMILDASQETDGLLRLFGGKADDTLKGGGQADLLHGNLGADILAGGGGADTFRYDSTADSNSGSRDQILDFTPGADKLDLTRVDANSLVAGDQAFAWIGSDAFSHTAGELRAFQAGGSWIFEGDTNGDGVGDLVVALTLQGATPLGAGDFLL
jgi:Ca2+-binding RTX toxin-like protein